MCSTRLSVRRTSRACSMCRGLGSTRASRDCRKRGSEVTGMHSPVSRGRKDYDGFAGITTCGLSGLPRQARKAWNTVRENSTRGWECFRFWVKLSVRFVFRDAEKNRPLSHGARGGRDDDEDFSRTPIPEKCFVRGMVWVRRTELGTRKSKM